MKELDFKNDRYSQYRDMADMLASLLLYAINEDIPIRMGEMHRTPARAKKLAKRGVGIRNSKHIYSLAIDIWIACGKNGKNIVWNQSDKRYDKLGKYWLDLGGVWGGNFKRLDKFHFEYPEKPA